MSQTAHISIQSNEDIISDKFKLKLENIKNIFRSIEPKSKIISMEKAELGFSNLVSKVTFDNGHKYCMKICVFPGRSKKLVAEKYILSRVQDNSLLPSPKLIHYSKSDHNISKPYFISEWIEGVTLSEVIDEPSIDIVSIGKELGTILAECHKINLAYVVDPGAGKIYSCWYDYISDKVEPTLQYFSTFGPQAERFVRSYYLEGMKLIQKRSDFSVPKLVHRDFKVQNIMYSKENKKVSGLIDFESHITGDRIFDFAVIDEYLFAPYPDLTDSFLESYVKQHDMPSEYEQLVEFYKFVLYSGYLKRAYDLKEVQRYWGYAETFNRILGTDFEYINIPQWAR